MKMRVFFVFKLDSILRLIQKKKHWKEWKKSQQQKKNPTENNFRYEISFSFKPKRKLFFHSILAYGLFLFYFLVPSNSISNQIIGNKFLFYVEGFFCYSGWKSKLNKLKNNFVLLQMNTIKNDEKFSITVGFIAGFHKVYFCVFYCF